MDICETFLNAYRDLEEVLAVKYGQKLGTVQMYASGEGSKYFEELNLFREMRNLLSHHGRIDGSPVVIPSEQALNKLLEILEYAKNPPMALSLATPKASLCCARLSDEVSKIVGLMEKRGYSHIPVLNKSGSLFGVFSVGTLFAFAKDNPESSIQGLTLRDLSEYLPPEKHTTEKFAFADRDSSLYEIKELFKVSGPYHRRVVAVFVTEGARRNGILLGMITPWDVFRAEQS
ncbi:MAG: CBS domain-containing protein [Ruminococcaceae bacterium]|nr:CBS domain-containing protein [Oscillospiraceae bacterium]